MAYSDSTSSEDARDDSRARRRAKSGARGRFQRYSSGNDSRRDRSGRRQYETQQGCPDKSSHRRRNCYDKRDYHRNGTRSQRRSRNRSNAQKENKDKPKTEKPMRRWELEEEEEEVPIRSSSSGRDKVRTSQIVTGQSSNHASNRDPQDKLGGREAALLDKPPWWLQTNAGSCATAGSPAGPPASSSTAAPVLEDHMAELWNHVPEMQTPGVLHSGNAARALYVRFPAGYPYSRPSRVHENDHRVVEGWLRMQVGANAVKQYILREKDAVVVFTSAACKAGVLAGQLSRTVALPDRRGDARIVLYIESREAKSQSSRTVTPDAVSENSAEKQTSEFPTPAPATEQQATGDVSEGKRAKTFPMPPPPMSLPPDQYEGQSTHGARQKVPILKTISVAPAVAQSQRDRVPGAPVSKAVPLEKKTAMQLSTGPPGSGETRHDQAQKNRQKEDGLAAPPPTAILSKALSSQHDPRTIRGLATSRPPRSASLRHQLGTTSAAASSRGAGVESKRVTFAMAEKQAPEEGDSEKAQGSVLPRQSSTRAASNQNESPAPEQSSAAKANHESGTAGGSLSAAPAAQRRSRSRAKALSPRGKGPARRSPSKAKQRHGKRSPSKVRERGGRAKRSPSKIKKPRREIDAGSQDPKLATEILVENTMEDFFTDRLDKLREQCEAEHCQVDRKDTREALLAKYLGKVLTSEEQALTAINFLYSHTGTLAREAAEHCQQISALVKLPRSDKNLEALKERAQLRRELGGKIDKTKLVADLLKEQADE
ncbi:unnamed protein product [Amoebophrya sp. A120]|nr:unnamed protein product [Amoebophrya sp. A120]|eukprot:GSA120T00005688001.1